MKHKGLNSVATNRSAIHRRTRKLCRARSRNSASAYFSCSPVYRRAICCNAVQTFVFHCRRGFASRKCSAYRYPIFGMKNSLLLLSALAGAPPLLAQTATPPLVPEVSRSQTVMDTLIKAGPVMIPLFLLSIFFVMLVIVYLMTIRRGAVVSSGYMATADALLRKRDYLGLLAVSNRHGEAIARG